ncbi:TetR/AcrR family transcriptional regulator [Robiginitalea aurantiaca]|uniref:TetR/AcrR family transcriptional regulator n=1 Tax=Robiginitalea aurantiaca TaxID=3056915 RepID=A0ABT7WEW8_9FLAO|nr:TetR/AcrR family transcriptional regulator [Robiginitalea aurantiaca]MDM9631359.1 TetR/AcrR family transcriptional regulator [Robiginitalea aurantiaca]
MKHLINNVKIAVNEKTYVKDPESSDLGKRIVQHGIALISEVGFENFTFRKLGTRIGSNESSVYRYFENKHKFLIYLTSWYWGWKEYQLVLHTNSIQDPALKLERALKVITEPVEKDSSFSYIDEAALYQILINEYSKSFLTKEVDRENKEGYFEIYKRMVGRLRDMIWTLKPNYPYPASLASSVLEGAMHQYFLMEHFPSLTDCRDNESLYVFFRHLVFTSLNVQIDD